MPFVVSLTFIPMHRSSTSFAHRALAFAVSAALAGPAFAGTAITIYNRDLAAVREVIPLDLQPGENAVSFSGMTAQARPVTVILRDPQGRVPFRILEQNYRNDPASEERLLKYFEGQEIDFQIAFADGHQVRTGRIVRAGEGHRIQPLIEIDGRLQFDLPGKPLFPRLDDDGILRPTLEWKLWNAGVAKVDAELAYLTGGFSWSADYNVVLPEEGDIASFMGWITLENASGTGFRNAKIKLIAGDVQVVEQKMFGRRDVVELHEMAVRAPAPEVETRSFDEYHLYELPRPTDLRDQETKQVEFTRAEGVTAELEYLFSPRYMRPGGRRPGEQAEFQIATFRKIANSEANKLGIALPAGIVRFYRRDRDGQLEFIGEDRIHHTPKDESLRLHLGFAFDLVGNRETLQSRRDERAREAIQVMEVRLRNRKDTPVQIRVLEPMYGPGSVISRNSHEVVRQSAQEVEFLATVAPGAEEVVTYTVTYRW